MITNETIKLMREALSGLRQSNFDVLNLFSKTLDDLQQYKDLEDQIGCPLEVRCTVVPDTYIYTFGATMDNHDVVTRRKVSKISKEGFVISYNTATGKERNMEFIWKSYKKTWWLKADRSE